MDQEMRGVRDAIRKADEVVTYYRNMGQGVDLLAVSKLELTTRMGEVAVGLGENLLKAAEANRDAERDARIRAEALSQSSARAAWVAGFATVALVIVEVVKGCHG